MKMHKVTARVRRTGRNPIPDFTDDGPSVPAPGSVSEERIAQLLNDANEGINTGMAREWKAAALYLRQKLDDAQHDLERVQTSVSCMTLGHDLVMMAVPELKAWLNSRKKLNDTLCREAGQKDAR